MGEFIASTIFNIIQNKSATQKGYDGIFTEGVLKGKTVNIKLYSKREGFLDLQPTFPPDYYLVMTGPKAPAGIITRHNETMDNRIRVLI